MSDQHRADLMGCAGEPGVITPNMDKLAAEGVRFSRVSCQGPLCMPSRASFMTERYVRDHGVYSNWADIDSTAPTYVKTLSASGYHTVMLGKAHLYRGFVENVKHVDEMVPHLQALGFDEVHETGDKFCGEIPNRYTDALSERGLLDTYLQHIADRSYQGEEESGQGATKTVPMWDSTPMPLPLDAYIDSWHGAEFVRWIEQYDKEKPFFAFVGFPGPHDPWDAPIEAIDRYEGIDVSMPNSTTRPDLEGIGKYGILLGGLLDLSDTETMTEDAIRGMRRAYSADITVIDDAIGKIIAALKAKGVLENTWIIYTSDHGEMGGNHSMMSKCTFYEPSVRVPLIIRPPGGSPPLVVSNLIEHMDVPATVREIAGAGEIPNSEGRSLLGYLQGENPQKRAVSISENWGFASFETDDFKIVVDEDALIASQLFHLHEDPTEDRNLVADSGSKNILDDLMSDIVRPFFKTPAVRPHESPFANL